MHPSARRRSFFDLYAHNFVRIAAAVPRVVLADVGTNVEEILRLASLAENDGAAISVFPELCLSGYTLDDLHQQDALLDAVLAGLQRLAAATEDRSSLLVVGAPLRSDGRLFNCAVVLSGGRPLGVIPKSYLPNYREYYEARQFAAARHAPADSMDLLGEPVPFGPDLLFRCQENEHLVLHVEVCEDVWVPVPPSTFAALGGATVLANLSASNITVGKSGYRHQLAGSQSARCLSAYVYTSAGTGESSTDLAWDGHALVYENGNLLAESERFCQRSQLISADVDLDRLVQDRMRMGSFSDCALDHGDLLASLREIPFRFQPRSEPVPLRRRVKRHPFVPRDSGRRDERCQETESIQVAGLTQRLRSTGITKAVLGISGGLDSTQALLVTVRTMDVLGLPRSNVLAYTLPAYATSDATLRTAQQLMRSLGVTSATLDIRPSCDQMLKDIGHPFAQGEPVYDVTFENVQAGERTSHLFRLANRHGGLVVGTGDLSELALGWCTYGVGDHMSHYNVNASVPKTLIKDLIAWRAGRPETDPATATLLRTILDSAITPELVPGSEDGVSIQRTEDIIGPYELHDFSLYYITRRGYRPSKVAFLAAQAWAAEEETQAGNAAGHDHTPDGGTMPTSDGGSSYTTDEILRWLEVFLDRFFRTSQFKRSALPNGPKVGSGGSLSPRGDWRAPSDSSPRPWLDELMETKQWVRESRP